MSNVIDALKRLERAGAENSRTTEKLLEAAKTFANEVEKYAPHNVHLPRNYVVLNIAPIPTKGRQESPYLCKTVAGRRLLGTGFDTSVVSISGTNEDGYSDLFADHLIAPLDRKAALDFAQDIATGWLDELAEFIEKRAAESGATGFE